MTLALGWYADITRNFWHVGIFLSFTAVISGAIMLNPPSDGAKFFALFLNGSQYASQTTMFAWANALLVNDDAKRSFILAAMNTVAIAVYMFWSIVFYRTTQAPMWHSGSIAMICMGVSLGLCSVLVWFVARRSQRKQNVIESFGYDSSGAERVVAEIDKKKEDGAAA